MPTEASHIERAKQELEHMIDLNPQPMLLVDDQATIIRANRAVERFLDLPDIREALGKPVESLFGCDESPFVSDLLAETDGHLTRETRACPGTSERLLEFTVIKSRGDIGFHAVLIRDVTEVKSQASDEAKEHKREAIRAMGGALMHRINQPLTVIIMRARLVQLAVQRALPDADTITDGLDEIVHLAEQVADTLTTVSKPRDYVTQRYTENVDILDLDRSSSGDAAITTTSGILDSLVDIIDVHVPGYRDHSERCARYAAELARLMGLSGEIIEVVQCVGLLHDIGKIGIPDDLLHKSAPLSDEDRQQLRRHVEIARKLLQSFPLLAEESAAVCAHHEHFDGSGYPQGLKGDRIPVAARIVAVADAFETMRFGRSYRDPIPPDRIVEELNASAGSQFDPDIVSVLLANMNRFEELHNGS
jgi:HD-GYP domain-containing protein (c-di-GMP phosphodiesterase class II)